MQSVSLALVGETCCDVPVAVVGSTPTGACIKIFFATDSGNEVNAAAEVVTAVFIGGSIPSRRACY